MDADPSLHPTDQALSSFGLGKLDDGSDEAVNQHLEGCADCRKRVAEVSADSFLGRVRDAKAQSPMIGQSQPIGTLSLAAVNSAPPPPADTLPPGLADHADYELKRELGRGGMGVVYLAHNRLMGRDEVVKVMGRQIMERPGILDRFVREIRSVAKLRHPNIVTAYSASRLGESIMFAMEYVEGLDLSKMVNSKGPLPVAHACLFVHQAALGLQHAHEKGLVHRDIKPANLMLSREGNRATVKVLDFGLAKATREAKVDGGLTSEGQALGTPDFIAPEQILDAPSADIRADIYSLGATLYYLLTGRPPFQEKSLYDIYQAHISRDADPLNLVRPEVPAELAALVAKMMAKEPRRRFQTPGEVAQALTPFFKKGSVGAPVSNVEASQVRELEGRPESPAKGSVPTQPATNLEPAAASPVTKTAARARAEPQWETLIEFKETEPAKKPAPDVAVLKRPIPRWLLPAVAAGVLVLGLAVAWGVILRVKTANGMIELVNLPKDSEVLVDGNKVDVTWPGAGKPAVITVTAGKHKIAVKKDGIETSGDEVTVPAEGKEKFTVRFVPPTKPPHELPNDDGADSTRTANKDARPDEVPAVKTPSSQDSITNSIGMTLNLIPAGEFWMGSPETHKDAEKHEQPQHRVRITRPFYLGVYEVTQAQYEAVMGNNPSYFSASGGGSDSVAGQSTDRHPVENVSWLDAVKFCNKLGERDGRRPFYEIEGENVRVPDWSRPGYRLPTEAEWEYACRANAPTVTRYSFGNGEASVGEFAWCKGNSGGKTHPAGVKRPNGFGLFDMHGNVCELCWDGYGEGYYKESREDDPRGPDGAASRVRRGGSWHGGPRYARSADRMAAGPVGWLNRLGFRVARDKLTARLEPPVVERAGKIDLPPDATQRPEAGPAVKTRSSQDSITNSIGMALKLIPAGEFMMGSPENHKDAGLEEKPQHRVRISKSFYIGVYEVTQAQYKMENNPSASSPNGDGKDKVAGQSTDQYPVEGVSWFDAVIFCNKLSAKEGRKPFYEIDDKDVRVPDWNGPGYRLPTEAEWEYACRANAPTPTRYSFGDDAAQLGEYGWFQFNSSRPHPVGRKKRNGFGLHDMHGNVSEWCWDWHGEGYYKQSRKDDPTGPVAGPAPGLCRLIRGGSSDFGPNLVRAASRNWGEPAATYKNGDGSPVYRDMHVGFRLAVGQSGR